MYNEVTQDKAINMPSMIIKDFYVQCAEGKHKIYILTAGNNPQ